MLIGNGVRLTSNPMRTMGGAQAHAITRPSFHQQGAANNQFTALDPKSGVPNGYRHPGSWRIAMKPGGLSSYNFITAAGDVTAANLAGGLNGEAALTGAGDILAANLALVVSAVATIIGAGGVTGNITGKLEAAANLTGSSSVIAALGALAEMVCEITGGGDVVGNPTAYGNMSADIVVSGELLNTANVAEAVWGAVAAAFNNPDTMGALMNGGAAGGMTTEQATQLLEIYRLHGLDPTKPLIVSPTTRTAGAEIEQNITDDGGGTTTVERV